MTLIDTHSHIYVKEFDDTKAILQKAIDCGIKKILLPAIDATSHSDLIALCASESDICSPMMGLHPCSVKENYKTELAIAENYLSDNKIIAIGETGLDFYWDTSFSNEQYKAFETQLQWAKAMQIPVVIHSRNSIDECIAMAEQAQDGNLAGVFHCFSGSLEQANRIIDIGFYLGIGGVVTFKNSGVDKVIEQIDMRHLVLETDAPYLAPVPFRGKRNEPAYLKFIAEKLAEVKNISIEAVATITTANAKKLFAL